MKKRRIENRPADVNEFDKIYLRADSHPFIFEEVNNCLPEINHNGNVHKKTFIAMTITIIETQRQETYLRIGAPSDDSDQPAHLRSLIRILTMPELDSKG